MAVRHEEAAQEEEEEDMIEQEWRIVRAIHVAFLAAVAAVATACSVAVPERHALVARQPEYQLVEIDDSYQDCTQERDCTCGWCPPYGDDGD